MPPFKDETGNKYNRLTVVKRVENLGDDTAYLCKCDCGNEVIIRGYPLRKGLAKSCGCLQKERIVEAHQKSVDRKRAIKNRYVFHDDIAICYLQDGRSFIFDTEDYEKVKNITWNIVNGYAYSTKNGMFHRYILDNPDGAIDHINRNRSDERKCNLRICTQAENALNKSAQCNNKCGYKGVSYEKNTHKYSAEIRRDGIKYRIGRFNTPEEAACAYDRKAIELHGEFAYTNFPKEKL